MAGLACSSQPSYCAPYPSPALYYCFLLYSVNTHFLSLLLYPSLSLSTRSCYVAVKAPGDPRMGAEGENESKGVPLGI